MNLIIPEIVSLHVEEASSLIERRRVVLDAPRVRLKDIQRAFDDRIAAQLDALAVAGDHAWEFCEAPLGTPSAGAVFTAAVRTLEEKRPDRLDKLFALVGAIPETRTGLTSAVGWVERDRLQGLATALLSSLDPLKRVVGIAACSMHRVDPGLASGALLADPDAGVRARALRLVGEVACGDAVPACIEALDDSDPECRFWAAWSAVLLGNGGRALEIVTDVSLAAGRHRRRALLIALQAMTGGAAHQLLQSLAEKKSQTRWVVYGSGIAGDPKYVPWLIKRMADPKISRLAGEAFALITGNDLKRMRLEGSPLTEVESGPNDDPEDPNVDMDPDGDLPWPDQQKIEHWWSANRSRFHEGARYFMGQPVTREHCIDVLKNGYQRQRILAAHHLCLLEPGTPLFNTSAPAWRQQRLLANMT
jgi:uncharacterized protein (TIGR02270 family)